MLPTLGHINQHIKLNKFGKKRKRLNESFHFLLGIFPKETEESTPFPKYEVKQRVILSEAQNQAFPETLTSFQNDKKSSIALT